MVLSGNISPRTLTCRGNYSLTISNGGQVGVQLGSQEVTLAFGGSGTWTQGTNAITNLNVSLVSGVRTLIGTIIWGGAGVVKSFIRTGGTILGGTSTFQINATAILDIPTTAGSFWNVNTPANSTITLNSQMGIANNLVLSTTAANITTFASSGTFGWDAKNFTHGGGNTTCILNAGSTYNVSGTFQLLGSNDTTRATLRSSQLSTFNGTLNGTNLTLTAPASGSLVQPNMAISQESGVATDSLGALYPNRPTIVSGSGISFVITPAISPSQGPLNMQAGLKANFNLAPVTGVALVLFAITKDINSNGGQTIYAFQSYSDAPSNPTANLFRTLNWNTLAPPVSPIGIGYMSVT
jgi:hypothetical protein